MLAFDDLQVADCPICYGNARLHDEVDFNKSCEERRGVRLPRAGEPVRYHRCQVCGFCFAPGMHAWPIETFAERVYNADYAAVDPDYAELRPQGNAQLVATLFPAFPHTSRHLDYGGGNGILSSLLRARGWKSASYDPFVDGDLDPASLGRFDLVTAFEVLEHVPDIKATLDTISSLLTPGGVLLFSTLVSDEAIRAGEKLTWWYASPRNGHISLHTRQSLTLLAYRYDFAFASASEGLHLFYRKPVSNWAKHLIG